MEVFVLESKKKLKSLHGYIFERKRIIKSKSNKYYILKTKRNSTTFLYEINYGNKNITGMLFCQNILQYLKEIRNSNNNTEFRGLININLRLFH